MCGPNYPHSVRGRITHVEVYQAKIIHNGDELLKPNLELLEKNSFLRWLMDGELLHGELLPRTGVGASSEAAFLN